MDGQPAARTASGPAVSPPIPGCGGGPAPVRACARTFLRSVPHGHVDPRLLLEDSRFPIRPALLVTPDHYVTRFCMPTEWRSTISESGRDRLSEEAAAGVAAAVRALGGLSRARRCATGWRRSWSRFSGSPSARRRLPPIGIFDRSPDVSPTTPSARGRCIERFRIGVLATTDDPCATWLRTPPWRADPTWSGRVHPQLPARPVPRAGAARVGEAIRRLAGASRISTPVTTGLRRSAGERRRFFIAHGATSADHSHPDARTDPAGGGRGGADLPRLLWPAQATVAEAVAFRRHMLGEMARMSCEDGLVMTLAPRGPQGPPSAHRRPLRVR